MAIVGLGTVALTTKRFEAAFYVRYTDAVAYDPYSLERTFADLFRLTPLGAAAAGKVKSLAPALEGANGGG